MVYLERHCTPVNCNPNCNPTRASQARAGHIGLLRRGRERIGHEPGSTALLAGAITSLADARATQEPRLARMAAEVHQVADHLLGPARPGDG
jgi:hypothetical protein